MPLPEPIPGLVLHYSYLWHDDHLRGAEEGSKNRPCVIILAVETEEGQHVVTVVPVTHTPPVAPEDAVEIPSTTKHRLGLDGDRSWVVLCEANRFLWPGFDVRPVPGASSPNYSYGVLPPGFFRQIRDRFMVRVHSRPPRVASRE